MTRKKSKGYKLNKFYSRIFKRYDLINKLFTFGMDKKWRKGTVDVCLNNNPDRILDLCCGTGDLAIDLARKSKNDCQVVGYDMNKSMLKEAKKKSIKAGENVDFLRGKARKIPFEKSYFDCITISFGFRNLTYENPEKDKHVHEMFRVLRDGGKLIILESGVPENQVIRVFYKMYLYLFLIPLGGIISGNFKAYYYLAKSSANFYNIHQVKMMLYYEGFKEVNSESYLFGAANLIVAKK